MEVVAQRLGKIRALDIQFGLRAFNPLGRFESLPQPLDVRLGAAELFAFDTETTSTDPVEADLVGISLAVNGENGYYIPLGHMDDVADQLPIDTVIEALRPALTNPDIPKVAHNASYDLVVLRRYGLDVTVETEEDEWNGEQPEDEAVDEVLLADDDLADLRTEGGDPHAESVTALAVDHIVPGERDSSAWPRVAAR